MKNFLRKIFLFCVTVLFFGCSKELSYTSPQANPGSPSSSPTSSILTPGLSIDQLRNSSIKNDSVYTTLENGFNGKWICDPADIVSPDNTGTVLVNIQGRRLKRILASKDSIYSTWFGLKGDGSDETLVLQSAINASAGRALVLGSGTFFSRKLYLVSNLVLIGNDSRLRNIQAETTDNIFIAVWNLSNVEIAGVEISLNGIRGDIWSGTAAIQIQNCSNVRIHNCFIHDNTYVAIRLTGGNSNIRINNNHIENTDTGIHANNTNTDVSITDNIISKGTSEGITIYGYNENNIPYNFVIQGNQITHKDNSFGINISYAKLGRIENNTITDCLGGITLHDVVSVGKENYYTTDMVIIKNTILNSGFGIVNIGDRTIVSDNKLENIQQDGINANNYPDESIITKDVTILRNTITGPALAGGGRGGISVRNLQNSVIDGNIISKCGQAFSIRFNGICDNLLITHNDLGDGKIESSNKIYDRNISVINNTLPTTYFPADPSAKFKLVVSGNVYTTDTSYNTAPNDLGVYSDLNTFNVRTGYSLAAGVIKSLIPSWTGRIIQLKSTNQFSIKEGNNINLKGGTDVSVLQNNMISLQYDGNTWNEIARNF